MLRALCGGRRCLLWHSRRGGHGTARAYPYLAVDGWGAVDVVLCVVDACRRSMKEQAHGGRPGQDREQGRTEERRGMFQAHEAREAARRSRKEGGRPPPARNPAQGRAEDGGRGHTDGPMPQPSQPSSIPTDPYPTSWRETASPSTVQFLAVMASMASTKVCWSMRAWKAFHDRLAMGARIIITCTQQNRVSEHRIRSTGVMVRAKLGPTEAAAATDKGTAPPRANTHQPIGGVRACWLNPGGNKPLACPGGPQPSASDGDGESSSSTTTGPIATEAVRRAVFMAEVDAGGGSCWQGPGRRVGSTKDKDKGRRWVCGGCVRVWCVFFLCGAFVADGSARKTVLQ